MTGIVTSNKMTKALVVTVYSVKIHPKYQKRFKTKKKYYAACLDSSKYDIGQTVKISETSPVSKLIKWKIVD
jgi:small subunit ribosomal protein S17